MRWSGSILPGAPKPRSHPGRAGRQPPKKTPGSSPRKWDWAERPPKVPFHASGEAPHRRTSCRGTRHPMYVLAQATACLWRGHRRSTGSDPRASGGRTPDDDGRGFAGRIPTSCEGGGRIPKPIPVGQETADPLPEVGRNAHEENTSPPSIPVETDADAQAPRRIDAGPSSPVQYGCASPRKWVQASPRMNGRVWNRPRAGSLHPPAATRLVRPPSMRVEVR